MSENTTIGHDEIQRALANVRAILPVSPLTHSPFFTEIAGRDIFFKWENKLRTGSFKERGAVNFLASLPEAARRGGVCAASAGNHALALSYHASRFRIPCHIVMPINAPLVKIQSTKNAGASVVLEGSSFDESYRHAQEISKRDGMTFVSPFDHPNIVAGQATAGVELLQQLPDLDSLIVPVGGGGLAAGMALAIKQFRPDVFILGVRSEWADKIAHSKQRKAIPDVTIADGIAVKTIGALTRPILEQKIDKLVTVTETEIAKGIVRLLEIERTVAEGAGAAALAALLAGHLPAAYKRTAVVVSGSNIDMNVLSRIIEREMGERDRLMKINVSVPDRPGSLHTTTGIFASLGANVLEVYHDRFFSRRPGNVDITFLVEVRDTSHKEELMNGLERSGVEVCELSSKH